MPRPLQDLRQPGTKQPHSRGATRDLEFLPRSFRSVENKELGDVILRFRILLNVVVAKNQIAWIGRQDADVFFVLWDAETFWQSVDEGALTSRTASSEQQVVALPITEEHKVVGRAASHPHRIEVSEVLRTSRGDPGRKRSETERHFFEVNWGIELRIFGETQKLLHRPAVSH